MPFSFSFSSIFVCSSFFEPDVVDDLDPLPLLHVEDDVLADDAVGDTASSFTSIQRLSRKFVSHSRLKSLEDALSPRRTAPRRPATGGSACVWM